MIKVSYVAPEKWEKLAQDAHKIAFASDLPASQKYIDFAMVGVDQQDTICAYVTCRKIDDTDLYFSHAGAFPSAKNTLKTWLSFQGFIEEGRAMGYRNFFILVENTNGTMLRLASKLGFLIMGVRYYDSSVFVEHRLALEGDE